MEKYKQLEVIGKGSFGEVVKAQNNETGEIVAIKTMKQKYSTWDECMNLRELKSLRKLQHKNIVKLKEVLRVQSTLSFVFEHVDTDIYKLYESEKKNGRKLAEPQIRSIFYQLSQALSYMHKHGYFHRDLKPENILYSHKDSLVKLIDFGLAREIRSRPPYTEYVATRWYRAPELILRANNYNSPVDIFALGCIMAELYMFRPLFNGTSEQDQLQKITSILGTPSKSDWPEGHKLASQRGMTFPTFGSIPLSQVISDCPFEAVQLISECLRWDPQKRPTASKILQHPYFKGIESILPGNYFTELDETKNTTLNPSNLEISSSFGKEDASPPDPSTFANNTRVFSTNSQVKRMSSQFSQSDVSITNKLKGVSSNGGTSDFKTIKPLELDEYLNDMSSQGKPPLNARRASRLVARNNNINPLKMNVQDSSTPSFNDRAKQHSGFTYGGGEDHEVRTTMKDDNNDILNYKNVNKENQISSFSSNLNGPSNVVTGSRNMNDMSGRNVNSIMSSQGTGSGKQRAISLHEKNEEQLQQQTNKTLEYKIIIPSVQSIGNVNNRNTSSNPFPPLPNQPQSRIDIQDSIGEDDILGTYLPNNSNRKRSHIYSNTQSHPRNQQQIFSAVEKRNNDNNYNAQNKYLPPHVIQNNNNYNNINFSNSNFNSNTNKSEMENGRTFSDKISSSSNVLNDFNYLKNGNNTNNNNANSYNGNNGNNGNNFKQSAYVPQTKQYGVSDLYKFSNNINISNYSNSANSNNNNNNYNNSLASQTNKNNNNNNNMLNSLNISAQNNLVKNIYDFNYVKQPLKYIGLPIPSYDKKF